MELKGFGVAKKEDRGKELGREAVAIKMYICTCARAEYQISTFCNSS